jgi:cation diffusion facilitator CzcD-associated flavoprotein CzcO
MLPVNRYREVTIIEMNGQPFDFEAAIIGTGFSGMAAAIALGRSGLDDFVLLEKAGEIGGTWRDNQYPGACCDVPSQLYSFSFELNPDWSRRFSPAGEIHAYQQKVLKKYDLEPRVRYRFEVRRARYRDGGWNLLSTRGERLRARYLISAVGALHIPSIPAFEGLDTFEGKVMHSAQWDHAFDPAGRRIVVVGSAASAVQIVPQLARSAAHVIVLQRSANFCIPRKDRPVSRLARACFRRFPFIQRLFRWRQYCFNDFLSHPIFLKRPGPARFVMRNMVRRHLKRQVGDPALMEKLTPDYELGCKRILLTDDFYPALMQDNVALVTDAIDRFDPTGLITAQGKKIEADGVVLATGFKSSRLFGEMEIEGPAGLTMEQAWAKEIRAHRSVAVKGFPNLFMMYGPNSNLGHSSIIIMIEEQARYIARLLRHAGRNGKRVISVRPEAEAAYNEAIQAALRRTVWSNECRSWYKDRQGHIFSLWPHSTTRFIRVMRKASMDEYTLE